jgi:hypothetical protein
LGGGSPSFGSAVAKTKDLFLFNPKHVLDLIGDRKSKTCAEHVLSPLKRLAEVSKTCPELDPGFVAALLRRV